MNLETKTNGFIFNSIEYNFEGENQVISESQVLIGTNDGLILFDLSCTINGSTYTDINLFVEALKGNG